MCYNVDTVKELKEMNLIEATTMFAIIGTIGMVLGGIVLLIPTNFIRKSDKK